ncbi:MAG TPA: TIGR02281 family clan AA aspartic protease [Caulobacteraceae bacterium]
MAEPDGPWVRPPSQPPRKPARQGVLLWLGLLAVAVLAFALLARLFPGQLTGANDWGEALRLFGLLALVSSGLVAARRIDLGATARIIAGWTGIFAIAFLAYAFREDLLAAVLKARTALIPAYGVAQSPRSMVVGRSEGDGFYVQGEIDGAPVRFMVDTGASDIVLSPADAQRAGLLSPATRFSAPSETAAGIAWGAPVTVRRLAVGPIRIRDVPAFINQAPMSASLLGMAFLKRLDSFEVRGDRLFLRGRG